MAFSDVTRVICEGKKVKDLAKQKDILGKIKAGPATRFAPALREAHEIALKYTGYQDVYVLLTDGHGNDQQESINAITAIKNSRHEL